VRWRQAIRRARPTARQGDVFLKYRISLEEEEMHLHPSQVHTLVISPRVELSLCVWSARARSRVGFRPARLLTPKVNSNLTPLLQNQNRVPD
jgi:hypothetical protein